MNVFLGMKTEVLLSVLMRACRQKITAEVYLKDKILFWGLCKVGIDIFHEYM